MVRMDALGVFGGGCEWVLLLPMLGLQGMSQSAIQQKEEALQEHVRKLPGGLMVWVCLQGWG